MRNYSCLSTSWRKISLNMSRLAFELAKSNTPHLHHTRYTPMTSICHSRQHWDSLHLIGTELSWSKGKPMRKYLRYVFFGQKYLLGLISNICNVHQRCILQRNTKRWLRRTITISLTVPNASCFPSTYWRFSIRLKRKMEHNYLRNHLLRTLLVFTGLDPK